LNDAGEKQASDQANPTAEKWAKTMSDKFSVLAYHDSSFGQLQNVMDLAVVAALIQKEQLLEVAGLSAPRLMKDEAVNFYPIPKQTASAASAVRQGRDWLISASGGVEMAPWHIASETETVDAVGDVREQLAGATEEFWRE
jgi:hypothetical protein